MFAVVKGTCPINPHGTECSLDAYIIRAILIESMVADMLKSGELRERAVEELMGVLRG
jgi:hypothetical protein